MTLGGEAAAAVGPLGREASAETSASLNAEILSYSRSRGLFAGIALKGAVLRPDADANKALYKKNVSPNDLLAGGNIGIPEAAQSLSIWQITGRIARIFHTFTARLFLRTKTPQSQSVSPHF